MRRYPLFKQSRMHHQGSNMAHLLIAEPTTGLLVLVHEQAGTFVLDRTTKQSTILLFDDADLKVSTYGKIGVRIKEAECEPEVLLACATNDKQVWVFKYDTNKNSWHQLLKCKGPKRISCLDFSPDLGSIIIADCFGDIFQLRLSDYELPVSLRIRDGSGDQHTNASKAQAEPTVVNSDKVLLTGHFSSVLCAQVCRLTPQVAILATADRDNKVRISRYPDAFIIERMCFGHTDMVTSLASIPCEQSSKVRMVSGSADRSIILWDALAGDPLSMADLKNTSADGLVIQLTYNPKLDCLVAMLSKCKMLYLYFQVRSKDNLSDPVVFELTGQPESAYFVSESLLYVSLTDFERKGEYSFMALHVANGSVAMEQAESEAIQDAISTYLSSVPSDRIKDMVVLSSTWLHKMVKKDFSEYWDHQEQIAKGKDSKRSSVDLESDNNQDQDQEPEENE